MSPAHDARERTIVDAALSVALVKGLASTTVGDLAAEVGTSSGPHPPLLRRRWTTKGQPRPNG